MSILASADPMDHVLPHPLTAGDYFTNHIFMLIVSALLLMVIIPVAARSRSVVPKGLRNLVEAVLQFLREDMARPALGKHTDQFMPFLWTTFFLILTANLLGMIPFGSAAASIAQDSRLEAWQGTATGNLSITAGLALCAFFYIHISGMRQKGVGHYWNDFFFGHAPVFLAPLMIPLEIMGALVKPFALAVRLFANMVAGHIVIAMIIGFGVAGLKAGGAQIGITAAAVLGAVAIGLLEVFVAFLQAYIFTFLTTLFIGMAVQTEH